MADPRRSKTNPLSVDTSGKRPSSSGSSRPSTSSLRPSSSIGFSRPPSSLASPRPPSSASLRPPSSASTNRPSSAASFRPISQASHRPASRFSYRPARQASRLYSLTEQLVLQVTGMTNETADEDDLAATADHVAKNLDQGGGPSIGLDRMNARIRGSDDLLLIASHLLNWTNQASTEGSNTISGYLGRSTGRIILYAQSLHAQNEGPGPRDHGKISTNRLSYHLYPIA